MEENISKKLLNQLEKLHNEGKHQEIVEVLQSNTETETSYSQTSLLARALNNINRYEEALQFLEKFREQGKKDKNWYFRTGYSLYYIDGREVESIPYFERAIELGNDFPATYELLLNAKKYLETDSEENNNENFPEFTFTAKAFARLSLKMKLQPKHRFLIEDALDFMLHSKKWGSISGGGTVISNEGEPESCDIEIDLIEYSEEMKNNLLSIAEKLEIAKGSKLSYRSANTNEINYDLDCSIGKLEGLSIYVNKADIPEDEGIFDVYNSLINIFGNNGALISSYGENKDEIAMYFYGEREYNFMLNKAIPFLKENSICKSYRTTQIT